MIATRAARLLAPLTEAAFMRQVVELAEIRGWSWVHLRPAMTARSWRTPISGPLGKGWPDLVLCRPRDGRLLFVELKRDGMEPTVDQEIVLSALGWVAARTDRVGVYVWHPGDWAELEAVLR